MSLRVVLHGEVKPLKGRSRSESECEQRDLSRVEQTRSQRDLAMARLKSG